MTSLFWLCCRPVGSSVVLDCCSVADDDDDDDLSQILPTMASPAYVVAAKVIRLRLPKLVKCLESSRTAASRPDVGVPRHAVASVISTFDRRRATAAGAPCTSPGAVVLFTVIAVVFAVVSLRHLSLRYFVQLYQKI